MAKDDYFVLMYKLLKRLYDALKQGKTLSDEEFANLSVGINPVYWQYIIMNVSREGYISGIHEIESLSGKTILARDVQITPKGIEYLFSNSMMERVKNALKDFKDIVPGI
ncbi:YjcQ family protein [Lacticaseibacillus saniviri]|uniref:YjcQ family protein n=1 Tax=Lacticaseibacillus saniviri TaxID=931533 RepID=UPI0006CF5F2A|nr:YjcQ family protein [Lacticaseibacillus saniviri]